MTATPPQLKLPNVKETVFTRIILGVPRFVACTEAATMDAVNWALPTSSLSTLELRRLYNTGKHEPNGGRTTPEIFDAVVAHYHHTPEHVIDLQDALNKLRNGYVLTVAGDAHNLPPILWTGSFGTKPKAWHLLAFGPIDMYAPNITNPWLWYRDPLGRTGWVRWSTLVHFAFGPKDILAYPHMGWMQI